ncbi:MAG: LysE family transporter [Flavobacteriales bacterium]|nr:LysE family transporter [Flavobacteriales bacterium]
MIFLNGYLIGLGTIVFIGPVVFTLLQATLEKGVRAGISTALGIIVSDIVAVAICALGAIPFLKDVHNQFWLAIAGGLLLFSMGLKYIISPNVATRTEGTASINKSDYSRFFAKGFLVNFINPAVFLYWIGFLAYAQTEFQNTTNVWLFISAILAGIFTIDIAKTLLQEN